ncbi:hypothetical protein SUGI_0949440 [Cryptomeria japonica]|nr:hypothetical protein SUGI_0949440 [Cryptomeria japonica]
MFAPQSSAAWKRKVNFKENGESSRKPVEPQEQIKLLSNDYFFVEFSNKNEKWKTLNSGPYVLDGIGVHLIEWQPNFNPRTHTLPNNLVWVRLYNFPSVYWNTEILKEISKSLGTFISTNDILEDRIWGSFVRLCVNVNQISSMPSKVRILAVGEVWT